MKQFMLSEELKNGIVSLFENAIFPQLTANQILANINVLRSLPELSQPKEPTKQIPQDNETTKSQPKFKDL